MQKPALTEERARLGGSAPRFLVIYCSVMIILLAFFILLQTLETSKEKTKFKKGKGSFIRALETYGLGRVMGSDLPRSLSGARMPRMYAAETNRDGGDNPLNPEIQGASRSLKELRRQLQERGAPVPGRKVMLALPFGGNGGPLMDHHRVYLEKFAHRLLPLLLGRNCIVNVAVLYRFGEGAALDAAQRASEMARAVRSELLSAAPPERREKAQRSTYSSCRPAPKDATGSRGVVSVRLGVLIPEKEQ